MPEQRVSEQQGIELPRQNVTVVGSFNPSITTPAWVLRHIEVVEDSVEILFPVEMGAPIYRRGDLYWLPSAEKLIVYGPARPAGQFVSELLTALPHTPLQAAGINFQMQGELSPEGCGPWRMERSIPRMEELLSGASTDFSFSQVSMRKDGVRLTLKFTWPTADPEVILDFNYHLAAMGDAGPARAEMLGRHAMRAEELEADARRISEALLDESSCV